MEHSLLQLLSVMMLDNLLGVEPIATDTFHDATDQTQRAGMFLLHTLLHWVSCGLHLINPR
ncbi:MAG: hypothetical protein WAL24_06300, partial [Nitrososphaeraceae archaeon]